MYRKFKLHFVSNLTIILEWALAGFLVMALAFISCHYTMLACLEVGELLGLTSAAMVLEESHSKLEPLTSLVED